MKKLFGISLVLLLAGCASNPDIIKHEQTKKIKDKELSYLDKNSSKTYQYSKRQVQFVLNEGGEEKIIIDLVIDGSTKVFYSRNRKNSDIQQKLIGAKITNNHYKTNDFYTINLEIKNHWNNEYLVARLTRDYTLSNGESSLHYAANTFTLGRRGELVPQKLNLPLIAK